MFLIASTAFNLADNGRRGFEALLPAFDLVNITEIALGGTTVQLLRDIVVGILVGLPGSYMYVTIHDKTDHIVHKIELRRPLPSMAFGLLLEKI